MPIFCWIHRGDVVKYQDREYAVSHVDASNKLVSLENRDIGHTRKRRKFEVHWKEITKVTLGKKKK